MRTIYTMLVIGCFLLACQPVSPTAVTITPIPAMTTMISDSEPGERLLLQATVIDRQTGQPVPDAELYMRQTTDAGIYEEDETGEPRLRLTLPTDAQGQLTVLTILPGAYADDPSATRHIHVSVTAVGYEPLERVILFANDPNLTAEERDWEYAIVADLVGLESGGWQTEIELPLETNTAVDKTHLTLEPDQTTVSYAVVEEFLNQPDWLAAHGLIAGLTTAVGTTNQLTGSLNLDFSQSPPTVGENQFTIDLLSLTSDQTGRDNSIHRDVWGAGRYATAEFVVHALEQLPAELAVGDTVDFMLQGELTMRDTSQVVPLHVTADLHETQISGTAVGQINMRDFGITPPSLLGLIIVSETVTLTLDFTLQAQSPLPYTLSK